MGLLPLGVRLLTASSNGNKYWENNEEQPGRTRWVDYANRDFDTTQQDPI